MKIPTLPNNLIFAEVSAASTLIALCAVIGKTNNLQFFFIALWGIFLYALNEVILVSYLKVRDVGGSMLIHTFGAFYGVAISKMLNYAKTINNNNLSSTHSSYTTGMIGTLFLFCFWPSFNGALAETKEELFVAIFNTYFSLIASMLSSYVTSIFLNRGKFNMDHVLNATLAGGVVLGASADYLEKSYVAYILGFCIGVISTLMFEYMADILAKIDL